MNASDSFGQDKVRFNKDLDADDFRDEEIDTTSTSFYVSGLWALKKNKSHMNQNSQVLVMKMIVLRLISS